MGEDFSEIYSILKSKSIYHLGPFRQDELVDYYSIGSVFCLASIEEGLAMVIPQAMACGLPVICTDNSGGSDIVRDGVDGWVIPAQNVDLISKRIRSLYISDDLRKKMSMSAIDRVSNGFAWRDYGVRAAEIYSSLLNKKL